MVEFLGAAFETQPDRLARAFDIGRAQLAIGLSVVDFGGAMEDARGFPRS